MDLNSITTVFYKGGFGIKYSIKIDVPLNNKKKARQKHSKTKQILYNYVLCLLSS